MQDFKMKKKKYDQQFLELKGKQSFPKEKSNIPCCIKKQRFPISSKKHKLGKAHWMEKKVKKKKNFDSAMRFVTGAKYAASRSGR